MPLALPNLDDRRWADLVEEGRALIPLYAPEWTDHNLHDPGITIIELLAWAAEMDLYQLNRIPETHRWKFLELLGFRPEPPRPARTVLSLALGEASDPLHVPSGVVFAGKDPAGRPTLFRSLQEITVVNLQLQALQAQDQNGFRDLTPRLQRGESAKILGENPAPGAALYLGFAQALPQNKPVSLFFTFANTRSGEEERQRLMTENETRQEACRPQPACGVFPEQWPAAVFQTTTPSHHSARTRWEFWSQQETWQPLDSLAGLTEDDTRAFTLDGRVLVKVPAIMAKKRLGAVGAELHYLRCRFEAGAYDAAPALRNLAVNGVPAEQVSPVGAVTWSIAADATITGEAPPAGESVSFRLRFNDAGEISALHFDASAKELPRFFLLKYKAPAPTQSGSLMIEAELLDAGAGAPHQQLALLESSAQESSVRLFTLENGNWRTWVLRPDFAASGRTDAHFLLEATSGVLQFGNGEKGRVLPMNVPAFAAYHSTRAQDGNLMPGTITKLVDSVHNQALLKDDFANAKNRLQITNPLPATGGAAAETINQALGRVLALISQPQRGVTLSDYEALAKATPGTQLARVSARANFHPSFPCLQTPGIITLIILPYLPLERPMPSLELRQAVAAYLASRRVIGTRVEVAGPIYQEVSVKAKVRACVGINRAELQQKIIAALNDFFHPLTGGPDATGWPFGRDIYRSEVLQVMDETSGVDHVLALELIANGGEPQCDNLCIGSHGLVAAGQHQIEVQ